MTMGWLLAVAQTEADTAEGEDEGVAGTITRRDFSAPTGEDKLDKSILPEIMQVGSLVSWLIVAW